MDFFKKILNHFLILKFIGRDGFSKQTDQERPIILFSSCIDRNNSGDFIYNGGVKLYNLWAKLLRSKGFLSYIVTYDGKYQQWMSEHCSHVSLEVAERWKQAGRNLRFVSSWLDATDFVNFASKLYYHDCEPAYSFNTHFPILLKRINQERIILSCETRAEQAYYRSRLGRDTFLIPPYNDPQYFFADSKIRKLNLIGFTIESKETLKQIEKIRVNLEKRGIKARFVQVVGNEKKFTGILRTCDLFLGMNPGKDGFQTEGLARTQFEAMQCGAVVVAFDVGGNREFIFDKYNGRLIVSGDIDSMANEVTRLLKDLKTKEYLRNNGISFSHLAFTTQRSWPALKRFLDLTNFVDQDFYTDQFSLILNKQELVHVLGAPAYLHEDELPLFKKYAALTKNIIVEIGAGYGASALMFLLYKQPKVKLYSIDRFTMEEYTKPPLGANKPPQAKTCQDNVKQALSIFQKDKHYNDWQLIVRDSHDVSENWKKEIDLLFIDGDHSYEGVARDFNNWFSFVRAGGIIFLHDSRRLPSASKDKFLRGWQGPTKLARELKKRKDIELIDQAFSLTVWKKL